MTADHDQQVSDYLASLPEDRRAAVERLGGMIRAAAPELEVRYWDYGGGLIGYGVYHYRTKTGLEGDWFALGVGNRKRYISLYSNGVKNGEYLTDLYADRMPASTKLARSCFNLFEPELVDEGVVKSLVKDTLAALPSA